MASPTGNSREYSHMDVQVEIGKVFDSDINVPKKLQALENKYTNILETDLHLSPDDQLFFNEAIRLVSVSRAALDLEVNKLPRDVQSEANLLINGLVENRLDVIKGVRKTLSDPDIAPYVEPNKQGLREMSFGDVFIVPALDKAEAKKSELVNFTNNKITDPVIQQRFQTKMETFNESIKTLTEEVLKTSWQRNLSIRPAVVPPAKVPAAQMTEQLVAADGNCGFHATNTSREALLKYTTENLDPVVNAANVKLAASDVQGWLRFLGNESNGGKRLADATVDPHNPQIQQMASDWNTYQHNCSLLEKGAPKQQLIEHDNAVLTERLSNNPAVFKIYMDQYYGKENKYLTIPDILPDGSRTTGVMDIIANMKKAPICVWKTDQKKDTVYLHYKADPNIPDIDKKNAIPIHIIHRGIHFNKLNPTQAYQQQVTPKLNDRILYNRIAY